ncbi:beta-ketoacyl-ACP synthase III [Thermospira aquatica]|uniref:Beta-ketoacyl-[acyl-carrier-protein] synthase III n=1 Tax=Thermospira aquatica TaxID=2828656 RepID=A0AAX3BDH0_9SPIR|nr:beta-ketoacyl-ACP synthase III [Thermospira aquatica]URA10241.1 ketoacyl-ACP synthase III [Thermospira aquatica]
MYKAVIKGMGMYVPEKVLTNHDLEKMVETNDEWITTRTGIKERRIAADDQATSDLAVIAARQAIEKAGLTPQDIDMVIVATITPDYVFPATAALVQDKLGIPHTGTVDIEAACSGFIYALSMANAYVVSGMYKNVLVIGAETLSRIVDWQDRTTCILFGDGAGAAVIGQGDAKESSGFIGFSLGGDGSYADLLALPAGGSKNPASHETVDQRLHYMKMNGNATFKVAVRTMTEALESILKEHNIDPSEVKLIVPHQANLRIISAIAERLSVGEDRVMVNLQKYGNTSSATIPMALYEAIEEGRVKKGDLVAMVAFGGGFTWGAALLRL